jgi:hypothetical protein
MKVYANHKDGTPALWYDEDDKMLKDDNTAMPVDDEQDADDCADVWFDVMADGRDYND